MVDDGLEDSGDYGLEQTDGQSTNLGDTDKAIKNKEDYLLSNETNTSARMKRY